MSVLTINTGSSSVRLGLYLEGTRVRAESFDHSEKAAPEELIETFLQGVDALSAIGHRVVHGGTECSEPCLLTAEVRAVIEKYSKFAPLHNPRALQWIDASTKLFPDLPQIAEFDTAFFAELPEVATRYGIPNEIAQQFGIRRYGFHGIAHEFMYRYAKAQGASRLISFQLGSGCSTAAVKNGRPLDTSMGFSPLEGLLMGTRAGDLDPGIVFHLLKEGGFNLDGIETLLTHKSGLLGVSSESNDMRALVESTSKSAQNAVDLFCYRAQKYLGAYVAVLGGLDAIVFGGGIGENQPKIRERIVKAASIFGAAINREQNRTLIGRSGFFHAADSKIKLFVAAVDEGSLIAEHAQRLLSHAGS